MGWLARLAIICLAALLVSVQVIYAQANQTIGTNTELPSDDVAPWLDGFVPYAIKNANIAGAVVVVVDRDGIVYQQGYGLADVLAAKPVSASETLFRPGSISKLFTATAVMQIVERGDLDLDADVNTYLDFVIPPYDGEPITLRQLLTHTPGFEVSVRYLFTTDFMPLDAYLRASLPTRVFAPGTVPAYSNYGSALAGYIVERVSGVPFQDYVAQNIFAPLNMTRSTFEQPLPVDLAGQMSQGYQTAGGAPQGFEIVAAAPAGALSATGADIGRFMVAHLNDGRGLLAPATARMMQDYRAPGIDGLNGMALGFYEKSVNGHRGIGHGGDTLWFHSDLTLFPDAGIGIYISLNTAGSGPQNFAIRQLLLETFADRYLPPADPLDIVPGVDAQTARAHLELVSGTYVMSRGSMTNFMRFATFLSQTPIGMTPNGKLSFPMFDGLGLGSADWVEVAPFIWQDKNSSQTVAAEVVDGRVLRLSTDIFSPFTVLTPAPPMQNAMTLLPAMVFALSVILLQALLWPTRLLIRRKFGAAFALKGPDLLAYRGTGLFAWGIVLAVIGWVIFFVAVSGDVTALGGSFDWLTRVLLLVLPAAAFGLVITSGAHLLIAFGKGRSWLSHIGRMLLFLSAIVVVWIVVSNNLYGANLRF